MLPTARFGLQGVVPTIKCMLTVSTFVRREMGCSTCSLWFVWRWFCLFVYHLHDAGKEFSGFKGEFPEGIASVECSESNILQWSGVAAPTAAPYDKHNWKFNLEFPSEYPFKPPKLKFVTPIYHPNFDEEGLICLDVINQDKWKPATKVKDILVALANILNAPEPSHPLRPELAEQFTNSRPAFDKAASDHADKNAEKR
jgi:ubiquitin-protein ligase